jgi:hypothetical protein
VVKKFKSWFAENQLLVSFLVAQVVAIGAAVLGMTAYMVKLEQRVVTLEVRGSPHLNEINNRLTVTEQETETNKKRIDRVVDVMTRELGKRP